MASSSPRVLVVDDDPQFRRVLRHQLDAAGLEAIEAGPSHDVVAVARRERPDVIVLDWRMPGQSGLEICRRLRSDEHVGGVPVVMLTGLSDPRDRRAALDAGALDMVTKGHTADLIELVREAAGVPEVSSHARRPR